MKENTVPSKTETAAPGTRDETRTLTPAVDIFETPEGLGVVVDMPGADKSDIEVDVRDNVLTIKGTSRSLLPGEPLLREYQLLNFFRQFQLGDKVDQEKIRAEMKYGVLTVHLPMVKEKQPKKITVEVAC